MILDNFVCIRGDAWNQMVASVQSFEARINQVYEYNRQLVSGDRQPDRVLRDPRGVDYRAVLNILGAVR
jgi:hypothetical protein